MLTARVRQASDGDQTVVADGRQVVVYFVVRLTSDLLNSTWFVSRLLVAPHYFKPADLEQLTTGEKKMPKTAGYSGATPSSTSQS